MVKFQSNHKKVVRLKPAGRWFWEEVSIEARQNIAGVILVIVGVVLVLSYLNAAGIVGRAVFFVFDFLLGIGYFLLPGILIFEGARFFKARQSRLRLILVLGGLLFVGSVLGVMDILRSGSGGFIGRALGVIEHYLGALASILVYLGVLLISILILSNQPLGALLKKKEREAEAEIVKVKIGGIGVEEAKIKKELTEKTPAPKEERKAEKKSWETGETISDLHVKHKTGGFKLPPLSLLEKESERPSAGDIKANANIIKRTLEHFGIPVEMAEVNVGPTVTQYTLKPAQGVKLSKITTLQNDLSLALAAHPIRIEAPIPGKSLVGIEIPNKSAALVRLRNLIETDVFSNSRRGLVFTLGRDVSGEPQYADLVKFPHALIAGATGSGKSVFIHSIILTMLFKHTPLTLNFIMIDPKRVELSAYNQIPHLLSPVITDGKKSVAAFHWLVKEMERRYDLLLEAGCRDIEGYNRKKPSDELPYIVLIIDELADLMAAYSREVEGFIVRLAQMSRATGIHLLIATQRPSVEVITGLIKANIPARVAFQVISQVDSRTILDMSGAEKLLGSGDMLYLAPDSSKPRRLQGPFLSEREIKKVVAFWAKQDGGKSEDGLKTELEQKGGGALFGESKKIDLESHDADEDDELYPEALEVVLAAKKASASLLQRRLKVGYARAARLLDILEAKGVIGPGDGAKPRKILIENPDDGE